jgi:hypothetical protein
VPSPKAAQIYILRIGALQGTGDLRDAFGSALDIPSRDLRSFRQANAKIGDRFI